MSYLNEIRKRSRVVLFVSSFSILSFWSTIVAASNKRIIALAPHSVEMLYLIGSGENIVGTTDFADYPEEAKSIPRIGGYNGIQIETVLQLNPDLIIAWEGGNKKSDLDRLKALGLPMYISVTKSLAGISEELREMGRLTGRITEANKYAKLFDARLSELRAENSDKANIKFFYQLWNEPLRTISAGSWINEMLTICGGTNIFNDPNLDYPQVSIEHVVKGQPDAIIIPSHHGAVAGTSEQWRSWKEIPAVRDKAIYHIDGDLLHRFSYRVLNGIDDVCSRFDELRSR